MNSESEKISEHFRCGLVAVLGRPNVGKSTLVNALVGQKISIVAPRPQTTRHRVLGVVSNPASQIVLIDTPGLHAAGKKAINRYLNRAARGAASEAQVNLIVLDGLAFDAERDGEALRVAKQSGVPMIIAINKIDEINSKDRLLPLIDRIQTDYSPHTIVPISALKKNGLEQLMRVLESLMPIAPPTFDLDAVTDRSQRFLAAEMIREQLMRQLREEVPYSATVEIESFETSDVGLTEIHAVIWIERDSQKAIVIGKGGEQLKKIGTAARKSIETMVETKVFLKLWVRVREGWSDDEAALRKFGYEE